tara:strand:+ start:198 stop:425 length:228 start_codon:yes stop_codon:yes gene_type:complete
MGGSRSTSRATARTATPQQTLVKAPGNLITSIKTKCNDKQRAIDLFNFNSLAKIFGHTDFVDPFAPPDDIALLNS